METTNKLEEAFKKVGKFELDNVKIVSLFFWDNANHTNVIQNRIDVIRKLINDEAKITVEKIVSVSYNSGVQITFSIHLGKISIAEFIQYLPESKYENECDTMQKFINEDKGSDIVRLIEEIIVRSPMIKIFFSHIEEGDKRRQSK